MTCEDAISSSLRSASSKRTSTSALDRLKLSVLKAYTLRHSTPSARDHCSTSSSFSAPNSCPFSFPKPRSSANRRLPSIITATCFGTGPPLRRTRATARRSHAAQPRVPAEDSRRADGVAVPGVDPNPTRGHHDVGFISPMMPAPAGSGGLVSNELAGAV